MINIEIFTFNPFQENTYLLYDEQGNCAIIDPGMSNYQEEEELAQFIAQKQLRPILLLNTHCHIDHIIGNKYIYDQFGLIPQFHEGELPVLIAMENYGPERGFRYEKSPIPTEFLPASGEIQFGAHRLAIIFAPGHSPAHLCFYNKEQNFLIGGDVLFRSSIGRTDLPGGNHEQLLHSIRTNIYSLPEQTIVYPGHGPATTIAFEKLHNPYVSG
ncbi:MBL fold metallo-hydrolase [Sphingobacteriaceae bacterium WQ 2009]|uniref:MBL fold metallo-hydrolase n=1 Tax=Rhinopithecimicrobium faecis TaxID=2820698 RepID=A0A8T4HAR9_9SPHI|nr:MBL fold metallo-hydrolase [Sphingobacteriaceae bacterium WQ 2009]